MKNTQNSSKITNDVFARDSFQNLKGILALLVLVHHLHQFSGVLSETPLNFPMLMLGHFAVSGFLFMSGFGLLESYLAKGKDYIRKFPRNRLLTFGVTYMILVCIYFLYEFINRTQIPTSMIIKTFTYGETIISFGWYLQLSMLLYVVFYLVFKIPEEKHLHSLLMLLFAVLYTGVFMALNYSDFLFTPLCAFLLGMVCSVHKEKIRNFIEKFKFILAPASLVLFGGLFFIYMKTVYTFGEMNRQILPFRFVYLILVYMMDATVLLFMLSLTTIVIKYASGLLFNPVFKYLGVVSLEIYVLQGIVLRLFFGRLFMNNNAAPIIASALSAVCIPVLAWPFHLLFKTVNNALKGNKKKS